MNNYSARKQEVTGSNPGQVRFVLFLENHFGKINYKKSLTFT